MGRFWIITNRSKLTELTNRLYSKEWVHNIEKGAKLTVMLELLEVLYRKGMHIMQGRIEV